MKAFACAMLAAGLVSAVGAQTAPSAITSTITFSFDNPALQPPHYVFVVHEDGTGTYHADAYDDLPALDRPITIAGPLRKALFDAASKEHGFTRQCDSGVHHLAFAGTKTIQYAGPGGTGTCNFNYARDAQLQRVSSELIAASFTIEEGRRLAMLRAHDPLGLDEELGMLTQAHADGTAEQIENIAPVLRAIAGDEGLLHRARARAQALLLASDALP